MRGLASGESVPQEISSPTLPCPPIGKKRPTEFILSMVSAVTRVQNPQQLGPRVTRDAVLDTER